MHHSRGYCVHSRRHVSNIIDGGMDREVLGFVTFCIGAVARSLRLSRSDKYLAEELHLEISKNTI